jgi:hypothetical protein
MLDTIDCAPYRPLASHIPPVEGSRAIHAFTLASKVDPAIALASRNATFSFNPLAPTARVAPVVVPVTLVSGMVPPPLTPAKNGVRTSVIEVMAELLVTTVAIGIVLVVKPVVFEAGAHEDAVLKYT